MARPKQAQAQLEPDGANDSNYMALGSHYAGSTVWAEANYQGTNVVASGVLIDPLDVIVAGHYANAASIFKVGNGTNAYLPAATANVLNIVVYPGFDGAANTPDLAIAHLSSPIGNKILDLATVAAGDLLTLTGFGYHGTPSIGLSFDGSLRGWFGTVDNNGMPGNVSTLYYDNVDFNSLVSSQPGLMEASSSGGGVFNSIGQLVGLMDYTTRGTQPLGSQQFLDFAKSGVETWIATNLTPYLVFNTAGTNLILQWNGSFILQSSTNVAGGFSDITNAASPYTNAMTALQMFFRLRSPP